MKIQVSKEEYTLIARACGKAQGGGGCYSCALYPVCCDDKGDIMHYVTEITVEGSGDNEHATED